AEDGIRDFHVTGVQTCALPIWGGALVATVLAAACGYAIAKYPFRGRETLFNVILGGVLVPATVIALPLYFLMNSVGLVGSYWSSSDERRGGRECGTRADGHAEG